MDFTFDSFISGSFDYDSATGRHSCFWLRERDMDIGGGKITISDIDVLKDYPQVDVVTISGLCQDTFEYFINTYGKQLRAIRFFKNKFVEDLSMLATLPQLEYVYFFANQRVSSLWDMRQNTSLTGLCLNDFSRLHSISGVETAPSLKHFGVGNAIWNTMQLESFLPFANTKIAHLDFHGRAIKDNDLSFLESMPCLETFDFATNLFTTEQVAWIVANFPHVEGFALKAKHDCKLIESNEHPVNVPGTIIVGKRKPALIVKGNEAKIEKYVRRFEQLKDRYRGLTYREAFPL